MPKRVDSGAGGQGLWRDVQSAGAGSKKTHAGKKKSATKPQAVNTKRKST